MSFDIVDIGTARLDPKTNTLLVQGKTSPSGIDPDDAPDCGDAPMVCALGVTAIPAAANDNGNAQAVKVDLPGTSGWFIAGRDTRTADVTAELGPGETCVHSTGEGFDSRLFLKEKLAALVVGDGMAFVMDEKEKKITLSCFGVHLELSEEHGFYATCGGGVLQITPGGQSIVNGTATILGGRNPIQAVLMGAGGPATVPIPGVFAGAG